MLGDPFPVWSQAAHPATRAKAAFLGSGELVVAAEVHWDGGRGSIHLLRFGRDGQQLGSPLVVAWPSPTFRSFIDPQIAAAGDRVGVYYQVNDNGMDCQVWFRLFDATLLPTASSGTTAAWAEVSESAKIPPCWTQIALHASPTRITANGRVTNAGS